MQPNSAGWKVIIVVTIFQFLTTLAVALRMFVRLYILGNPGLDDWIMCLGWVLSLTLAICLTLQVPYGLGTPFSTLPVEDVQSFLKAFFASILAYNASIATTKISIMAQYFRLFAVGKRTRIACWTMLGLVISVALVTIMTSIFMCTPPAYFWDKSIDGGHCIDIHESFCSHAALSMILDVMILIIPIPVLWELNMPRNKRNMLIGVFAVGGIVCLVSMLRLRSLIILSEFNDPTMDIVDAGIWSCLEVQIGQICACMPSMRALATRGIRSASSTPRHPRAAYNSRNRKGLSGDSSFVRTIVASKSRSDKGAEQEIGQELQGPIITVTRDISQRVDNNDDDVRLVGSD